MQEPLIPRLLFSLKRCLENAHRFLELTKNVFSKQKVTAFYAVKANAHEKILRTICNNGFGCEVLSRRELSLAKSYSTLLMVNGHYKSDSYLKEAIDAKPQMLIVESVEELLKIEEIARKRSLSSIHIGIRISHPSHGKLGMAEEEIPLIPKLQLRHCLLRGLHFHAGWNVREDKVIKGHLQRMADFHQYLFKNGLCIDTWNFGGGFCEASTDREQLYKRLLLYKSYLPSLVTNVHFEPGRYLVGDCGTLQAQVVAVRNGFYCLNTCAYHYRFSSASVKVTVVPKELREKDLPGKIVFSGHWPSENDQITVEDLEYTPRLGDRVIFHNLGAYLDGFKDQFSLEQSLDFDFDSDGS